VDVDRTTSSGHAALITDAAAKSRMALLDYVDTATAATLLSALATDRAVANSDMAGAYVNWVTVQPLSGATTSATFRPRRSSPALMARNDGEGLSVNEPPAGANGVRCAARSSRGSRRQRGRTPTARCSTTPGATR
jgi:hypothetical protein